MSNRHLSEREVQFMLGELIEHDAEVERDAIHIAVAPVFAAEELHPGERVKLVYGRNDLMESAEDETDEHREHIGVADPFLMSWRIPKGSRFWVWLLPNTITGLAHRWKHPAFDDPLMAPPKPVWPHGDSEAWIKKFCGEWNFRYDELIEQASADSIDLDHYIVADGIDLHSKEELGEDHDLFWMHLEHLKQQQFNDKHRERFGWSCSC